MISERRTPSFETIFGNSKSFKIMKNVFYFTLKGPFVLKIFKFLSWLFDHVEKRLVWRDETDFKIHGITCCLANYCHTHIT